jgi:hypothetical protein
MGSVSPPTSVYDERPVDSSIHLTDPSTEELNATNFSKCPFEPIAIVGMGEYLCIRNCSGPIAKSRSQDAAFPEISLLPPNSGRR